MKRIYSIDFLKLLFAYLIAFAHFGVAFPGANIAVNFFFIISGYFLGKKFYDKRASGEGSYTGVRYTIDHIKALYPHYIFSLLVIFVAREIYAIMANESSIHSLRDLVERLYNLLPEVFLVQNIGFFDGGINYPLWQLCALFICGYFIFTMLSLNEKLSTKIVFPLAIILISTYLKTMVDVFDTIGFFYIPLLRAFAAVSFGVLIYKFLASDYCEILYRHKLVLNICSLAGVISLFIVENNNMLYISMVVIVAALMDPSSWLNIALNHKLFKNFGTFSYAIYLNHALIIMVVKFVETKVLSALGINESVWISSVLFFVALTIYSLFTTSFIGYLKLRFSKRRLAGRN